MAGNIPTSGSVSVGDAAGSGKSLNELRNVKRSTTTNSQMAMSTLRDWFRTYVNPTGDSLGGFPDSGNEISMSDFHGMKIWGCNVRSKNESTSTYANSNNASLKAKGINGTGDYAFHLNSTWQYPSGSAEVEYTGLNGDGSTSHTLTVRDEGGTNTDFTLLWCPGYGTGQAKIYGTTTSGTNNQTYNWTTNSSSTYSEYSNFWVEEADPSGTAYG
jgi:hypothetical protein|tara:strand:+ start:430 stop:1074 length:645 start_codon:yes stop_codon:yes gene_type:complete